MANASSGEPLHYRHGVVLYSAQSTKGTPVTPATSCGLAMVGQGKPGGNVRYRGPGSPNLVARKGGMVVTPVSIRWAAVQPAIKTLLLKAKRSSGVLPLITLGVGYQDDEGTPNRAADQIQDCKIGSLEIGLDASNGHGPLTASIEVPFGGLVTELTTLAPSNLTTAPYWSFEGALTQEGAAHELRSFRFNVNHSLRADAVIPGSTPASNPRGPKYITEGAEVITGEVTSYSKTAVNPHANTISVYDLVLTMTSLDDASTLVLSATDVDYDDLRKDIDENGIFWSRPFEARVWDLV